MKVTFHKWKLRCSKHWKIWRKNQTVLKRDFSNLQSSHIALLVRGAVPKKLWTKANFEQTNKSATKTFYCKFCVFFCLIWSCWLLNKCVLIVIFSFIGNKWMILNEDLETEMFWSKWLKYQRPTLPFRLSKSGPLLLTRLRSRTIFNTLSCKTDQWDSTLPSQYSNTNLQSLSFLRFFFLYLLGSQISYVVTFKMN